MELEHEQRDDLDIWVVQLPGHAPFGNTRLKRMFLSDDTRHRVVIVDIHKLLACADRDKSDYVLSSVRDWPSGKVRGIREFLDPSHERIPEMPYVTFSMRRTRTMLGWIGLSWEGVVSFRNGQHRARYMDFAGATSVPVEVHETEAELLRRYCGN